jgi:hypothetical protein
MKLKKANSLETKEKVEKFRQRGENIYKGLVSLWACGKNSDKALGIFNDYSTMYFKTKLIVPLINFGDFDISMMFCDKLVSD